MHRSKKFWNEFISWIFLEFLCCLLLFSKETNSVAAENSGNPKVLASIVLNKNTPAQEHRTAIEGGRKPADLPGLKLSRWNHLLILQCLGLWFKLRLYSLIKFSIWSWSGRLSIDSTKSPILRESKPVGNSSQKSVLLSKIPLSSAHLPDKCKQTTSTLSVKRTLEVLFSSLHNTLFIQEIRSVTIVLYVHHRSVWDI